MGCTTSTMDVAGLPFELLVAIFLHDTKPNVLMTVAQVCRLWHHVVLHESSLWTDVCVTPDTTPAQLNVQLARSNAHGLSIEVSFQTSGSPDELDQCLSTIMLEYQRIEALVITSDYDWVLHPAVKTSWPAGLIALLLPGRIWPRLRTLRLNGELWSFNDFGLCLAAPVLRDLDLHTVSVGDWHRFGLGSRMCRLQISGVDIGGLFDILRGCLHLESLLIDDHIGHNYGTLHDDNSLALPTFHSLTHLEIKWAAIDLNMLIDLLAHCPNAERVSISHDNTLQPLASPYTGSLYMLSHLRAITLRSQWGGDDTLLHSLAPFIDFGGIEHMELDNMRFIDPSASFGAALRTLDLTGLVYESGDLAQALSQCTKLESLTIDRIITSTHDDRPVVMPLPLLRSVTVDCITKHHALSSDVLEARNRRLVDLIMALLPLPGVREVTIRTIPLHARHIFRLLSDICAPSWIVYLSPSTTEALTHVVLLDYSTRVCVERIFETGSLATFFRLVEAETNFFSGLWKLEINIHMLVETISAISALSSSLPLLERFSIAHDFFASVQLADEQVSQILNETVDACDGRVIVCPRLHIVFLSGFRAQVSDETCTRFMAIFRGKDTLAFKIIPPQSQ